MKNRILLLMMASGLAYLLVSMEPDMDKETFIKEVTDGLVPPPDYFPLNVKMNKEGYAVYLRFGRPAVPNFTSDLPFDVQ